MPRWYPPHCVCCIVFDDAVGVARVLRVCTRHARWRSNALALRQRLYREVEAAARMLWDPDAAVPAELPGVAEQVLDADGARIGWSYPPSGQVSAHWDEAGRLHIRIASRLTGAARNRMTGAATQRLGSDRVVITDG